jgi:hypothetical protein
MKQRTKSVGLLVKNMRQNTLDDTTVNTNYISTLVQNGDDLIMDIPEDLDWSPGDVLQWDINDNVITLKKLMTDAERWNRGLDLFIESVLKPDPKLRQCAHNQECFHELMWCRDNVLDYLKTLRSNEI